VSVSLTCELSNAFEEWFAYAGAANAYLGARWELFRGAGDVGRPRHQWSRYPAEPPLNLLRRSKSSSLAPCSSFSGSFHPQSFANCSTARSLSGILISIISGVSGVRITSVRNSRDWSLDSSLFSDCAVFSSAKRLEYYPLPPTSRLARQRFCLFHLIARKPPKRATA
jgi:hypothetical protein